MSHLHNTTSAPDSVSSDRSIRIILAVIVFLFALLIGIGNGLVLLVVFKSRRLHGNVYKLIASLSSADFMVSIALCFYLMAYTITLKPSQQSVLCYIVYTIVTLSTLASCTNLVCIAIDRSISINRPLRYATISEKLLKWILITAWSIPVIPVICIYVEPRETWIIQGTCSFGTTLTLGIRTYVVTHFAVSLVVMTVVYCQIYFVARSQAKRIDAENAMALQRKSDNKAMAMLGLVVGSFVLCYVPLTVTLGIQLTRPVSRNTALSTYLVTLLNSCLNPVIYVWKNRKMRGEILAMVRPKQAEEAQRMRTATSNGSYSYST